MRLGRWGAPLRAGKQVAVGRYKTCGTPSVPRGGNNQRPATDKDAHSLCVATCYETDLIKKKKKKKRKKKAYEFQL